MKSAFETLKQKFAGKISKRDLLKIREKLWLDAREHEYCEREEKAKDLTHLLLFSERQSPRNENMSFYSYRQISRSHYAK